MNLEKIRRQLARASAWMKRISRSKENGYITIVPLIKVLIKVLLMSHLLSKEEFGFKVSLKMDL